MTNFEKLKELKEDYEVALVVSFINSHVMTILSYSGASENLDAFDLVYDELSIIVDWLNSEYDDEVGFCFSNEYSEDDTILAKETFESWKRLLG